MYLFRDRFPIFLPRGTWSDFTTLFSLLPFTIKTITLQGCVRCWESDGPRSPSYFSRESGDSDLGLVPDPSLTLTTMWPSFQNLLFSEIAIQWKDHGLRHFIYANCCSNVYNQIAFPFLFLSFNKTFSKNFPDTNCIAKHCSRGEGCADNISGAFFPPFHPDTWLSNLITVS